MLMLIFVCQVISSYGFVLPDTFNLLIKDSSDYKVDMVITDEDYEIIGKKQLEKFKVDEQHFIDLDKMASIDYNNRTGNLKTTNVIFRSVAPSDRTETSTLPIIVVSLKNEVKATYIGRITTHVNKKREIIDDDDEMEYEYSYNDLLHEYYEQANKESVSPFSDMQEYGVMNSFKKIFLTQKYKKNCNKSIGLQAIQCLMDDYKNQQRPTKDIVWRLWRITQLWFLVYLIVAVPLWCTRGRCCCCLFCKFFKPRQTIEEAKKYLVLNPPGVFQTKNGEVHYDPTERERETYEEFEHFIKTL